MHVDALYLILMIVLMNVCTNNVNVSCKCYLFIEINNKIS